MSVHTIAAVLGGKTPLGQAITVQGWVRTRRDSKAGLSFVTLHDGSSFEPLQIIASR
jgi:asparaginyl-tRNA synthetase